MKNFLMEADDEPPLRPKGTIRLCSQDIENLSPIERVLISTDGTVMSILQAYYLEVIELVLLQQEQAHPRWNLSLRLFRTHEVVRRSVLLRGSTTRRIYMYAESVIVPSRLSANLAVGIRMGKKPIGMLLREEKLETYRQPLWQGRERVGHLACIIEALPQSWLLTRQYRIMSGNQPIMLITEKFNLS